MKWLGFIVLLTALLIPMPVMAIGVSPYIANITVYANSYTELEFTVTGCSEVDLSLEGIPLTVEPSHALVVDGKVTARILGSLSVPTGVYEGYLVILESGIEVGTGVKVNLTVNHINIQSVVLTTTVLQPSSGWYWSGGSGSYYVPPEPVVTPPVVIPPVVTPPVVPPTVVPPVAEPEPEKPYIPLEETPVPSVINWYLTGAIALVIMLLGTLIWYFKGRST